MRFLTGSQLASWGIACFANPRFAEPDLCQMQGQQGPSFIKARQWTWDVVLVQESRAIPPCAFPPRSLVAICRLPVTALSGQVPSQGLYTGSDRF